MVTSSDYLTSVNFVTVYPTREYAACNEAIATEYPLLQGTWDYEPIDYAFKALNDSKLEDLDPKYIQKQAKKATGLEARSSALITIDVIYDQGHDYPWSARLSNYGIKITLGRSHDWFSNRLLISRSVSPIILANNPLVVTPPAAEGKQFEAEARSSDQPMLMHTTCMAGYNLMFASLNYMEDGWMRTALRRVHTMLHLPFVYPAGFSSEYHLNIVMTPQSHPPLGCRFDIVVRSSSDLVFGQACDIAGLYTRYRCIPDICRACDYSLSGRVELEDHSAYSDYWIDPNYTTVEIRTSLKDIVTQQIEGRIVRPTKELWDYAQSDVEKTHIAELEVRLQEAIAYGQRQKEKLDAMVMVYNRTVKSSHRLGLCSPLDWHLKVYEDARPPVYFDRWQARDHIAMNILPHITKRPVRLYYQGVTKPICVETHKVCFARSSTRRDQFSVQHMGRTFNTPQEWRAYYEPIIARLDSPDASA